MACARPESPGNDRRAPPQFPIMITWAPKTARNGGEFFARLRPSRRRGARLEVRARTKTRPATDVLRGQVPRPAIGSGIAGIMLAIYHMVTV